jgi:hypothetical protein
VENRKSRGNARLLIGENVRLNMKSEVTFVLLAVLVVSSAAALTPSTVHAAAQDPHTPATTPALT